MALATLLMMVGVGVSQAQKKDITPLINKQEQKHQPRMRQGGLAGLTEKSDAERLRAEYRDVRKAELRAKSEAKIIAREREKAKRRDDKNSWAAYRQKHDRYGRMKARG